ncbi:MAG: ABC transporter substrate-binding protein [Acidimicrobiaceae bacterium]|nr:ABC transporter substrate-binding protein [Acidimicrobiaceae bacterium]
MGHIRKRLGVPLAALFVLALVAAGCGDDEPAAPAAVDTSAIDAAEAEAAAAQADADAARADADAAAAAAADAAAALEAAEAAAAEASAEQMAEAQAALEAAQAEAEAAMAAAAEAESRASEAEMAAEEAAMAAEEEMVEEAAPTGDPGRVTIAVTTEPSTLDPQAVNDRSSRVVTANLFESLLGRDASTALVPVLATGYEAIDEDTWRFTVREGVTFHDGQALDAQAVADALNRMLDPDYSTQRDSYIRGMRVVEAVDAGTVDIHTDGVNATLPLQIAQLPIFAPGTADTVGENPVGTGPYMFESWERGQQITAVRNPNYWGDAPSIDAFTVRFIPDKQTSLAALQAGEVDLVLDILPEQVPLVPQALSVPATEYSYIALNALRPDLAPPEIRVAMNLAVDKELIAETLYEGYAEPNHAQHLSPGMLGYNPDVGPFPYDPDQAREIMESHGWNEDNPLFLEIYAPIGRYLRGVETTQAVATMLNDVGFDTEVRLAEWTRFRAGSRIRGEEPGAYDARYGWNSNEWFDGARTRNFLVCGGSSSKLCDELVTDLFEQAGSTTDQDLRNILYQRAWARLHENPHAIYLLQQDLIYGATERLDWQPRLDDEYLVSEMSLN